MVSFLSQRRNHHHKPRTQWDYWPTSWANSGPLSLFVQLENQELFLHLKMVKNILEGNQ